MPASATTREYRFRWAWDLPASPEALWPLVSDTDAFNRDTGLPEVEDARGGEELAEARRRLRLSIGPVTLEWEELPFEWVRPHRFGVVRRYRRGPLSEMRVLAELEPLPGGGTRLVYGVLARPSGWLGVLSIPVQIGVLSRRSFGRVFRRYAEMVAADGAPAPRSRLIGTPADRTRLRAMEGTLVERGVDPAAAARLARHVAEADDGSLTRIRPYVMADVWELPRRAVLGACLHATRGGFLELHWDVICPLCRGVKETARSLAELRRRGVHCDTCLVDFSGDFCESVELSFRPAPAVREVRPRHFCVAGPQVTPHVLAQQLLAPGESRRVSPRLEPGGYRLRRHGTASAVALTVREGDAAGSDGNGDGASPDGRDGAGDDGFRYRLAPDGGWEGTPRRVGTDPVLVVENGTAAEALIVLERTDWSEEAVTAAEVTRLGVFRDLFSDDVLRAGDFAEVGTLSVLFTDLKGSTSMYRRVGDAPAFGRVMRHFEVLREVVDERDGAIVKTIGDAVMAVFASPERAVAAALDAQARFAGEPRPGDDERLRLKAGVHVGPCITVTLDGRLDYFGTTVNVAARLEALAAGDDVVVSDAVRHDPGVVALLEEDGVAATSSAAEIRGLDERLTVWRLSRPSGAGS